MGGCHFYLPDASAAYTIWGSPSDDDFMQMIVAYNSGTPYWALCDNDAGNYLFYSEGKLGIGTSTIAEALQVQGNTCVTGTAYAAGFVATTVALISTLSLSTGAITDSSGAISFGNENLCTTGTMAIGPGATTAQDGTLHVFTASGGTISPDAWSDDLIIENDDNGRYINIFSR